jgi:hypothetical protein
MHLPNMAAVRRCGRGLVSWHLVLAVPALIGTVGPASLSGCLFDAGSRFCAALALR